jgi:ribonuclease HI
MQEVASAHGIIGDGEGMSNNVAEYRAVLEALHHAKAHNWQGVASTLIAIW